MDAAAEDRTTRLARLKLVGEMLRLKASIVAMPDTDKLGRLRAVRRVLEIRRELGAGDAAAQPPAVVPADPVQATAAADDEDTGYEGVGEARNPSAAHYDFNPNRKPSQRKRENSAAIELLRQIRAGDVDGSTLTGEQKTALARYSGTGGNLVGEDGAQGSAYEYYTPKPIAEGAWELLRDMGFAGGKVLDPCAGVGIFGGTAPASAVVDAVELNETSGQINGLVNQGPGYNCKVSNFERIAATTPDGIYDAVISNVPFGNKADRGSNYRDDPKYQDETLEGYFILRSLEKLKPGGLAAFICPPRCVSGKGGKEESVRLRASLMAEFMGAYRLPSTLFLSAGAETVTDLLVFRKHSADALETIQDLADSEPAKLREALVVWPGFIDGGYFAGEGARYVLGEFKAKDPTKFRDVDRVISDKKPVEIAKLLRKFGGSRIDWTLLNADPAVPIIYRDGDTVTQGGQMLQMREGAWVPIERQGDSPRAADLGSKLATPMHAFAAGLSLEEVAEWAVYMHTMSKSDEVPQWLRETLPAIMRLAPGDRARYWPVSVTALCVADVLDRHGRDSEPMHYATEYPALSEAMQRHAADAGTLPTAAGSTIRDAAARLRIHYTRKGGFSAVWRGDVVTERADGRTLGQRFEAMKYAEGGTWVTREQAAEVYGADFDPIADPAWCISPDGRKVCRADDFYTGNYGDMLAMLKDQAAAATDDTVRGKLLGMAQEAHARVQRVDASKVNFNLSSPFVTTEEKAEFLRRYYGDGFSVSYETGEPEIEYDVAGRMDEDRHKLLRRFAYYVRNGTVTLQKTKFKGMDDRKALLALRKMAREANEQFGAYCRANQTITRRLEEQANDPTKMHFPQTSNTDPVPLPGWKMGTPPDGVTPHGYQYAEIRRRGHFFGGINGYGVGLGKSFTALACVQHAQAIGIKKRTAFVVPNSVLSNWRKEARVALEDMDQCLFVGLGVDKKGNAKMDPGAYDADLSRIAEGRHSKIFMTFEAFRRLRLRDETLDRYLDSMGEVDSAFETIKVKDDGNIEPMKAKTREAVAARGSRLADAIVKGHSASAPFLEDLGIDSIALDEAQVAKNSTKLNDFKGAKFLSIADPSGVGMDLQAKAAYIRGLSPKKDGVLLLTATPVTNSPIEVYAMLSLAVGADRVNDMAMGIKGPDDFMNLVCEVESEEDETLDGILRDTRVFKGLQNVDVLRRAIAEVITIETPETVGMTIQLPDADALATPVAMPDPPMIERLKLYKGAYRWAVDKMSGRPDTGFGGNRGSKSAYESVAARFNEPIDLIGHPFNMVRKMTAAIMDPELDDIATFYTVPAGGEEKAAAVVAQFNALKIDEERARPGPRTLDAAVVGEKTKKVDGDKVSVLVIRVAAVIEGNRIVIDSIDPDTIAKFEKLEEKAGLDLDVSVPPKLAAMLDNFRREEMTPRGVDDEGKPSPVVKQIIFCDILAMHAKIKRLLRKQAGVSGGAIAIITGRTNNKPEDILAVQDGFNAHGAANKFRVVIANEKAEVGINLQRGTQAIHHLTIGWTPDSLTQRDGRGVRQGNKTERVSVYSYDADGTFDQHKRGMVNKKADWIDSVMDIHGSGSIQIDGGLTREQEEALIETVGDADAMIRFTETLAAKERTARQAGVREKQAIAIKTINANQKFLKDNDSVIVWAGKKLASFAALADQSKKLVFAARDAKSEVKKAAAGAALADVQARMAGLEREISGAFDLSVLGFASVPAMATAAVQRGGKDYNFKGVFYDSNAKKDAVPIEGSALQSDYEFERSQAEAMIKASRAQFASYSARDGGIPAEVVDKVIAGEGRLVGDVPVVRGTIILSKGMLYVVKDRLTASAWQTYSHGPELYQTDLPRIMPFDEVHYPGSDSYPAAAERAAKIEDDMLGSTPLTDGQRADLFATQNEVIAARRKGADLVAIGNRRLPPPYFPFSLSEHTARTDPVLLAIHTQQKAIVKTAGTRDCVASAVQLLPYDYSVWPLKCLREWCAARGERVTIQGANRLLSLMAIRYTEVVGSFLPPVDSMLSFEREVEGKDEEAVKASALAWLVRNTPQLDLGVLSLDSVLPPQLSGIVSAKVRAIRDLAAPPPAPAPEATKAAPSPAAATAPKTAPDAVNTGTLKETDMVGIRGDTRPVKDFIKAVANELGGYRWAKDAEQWNVQFRAWKAIIERRPDLAKTLEMTIYRAR
jgi:hypothetical protein